MRQNHYKANRCESSPGQEDYRSARRLSGLIITIVLILLLAGCAKNAGPEPQSEPGGTSADSSELGGSSAGTSDDGKATAEKPYYVSDLLTTFDWCGRPAAELGIHKSYIGRYGIDIAGKLFGGDAEGTADFAIPLTDENIIDSIYLYIYNDDLSAVECLEKIEALYGAPVEQGEEPYVEANGGAVEWKKYNTGTGQLSFSMGSENSWYSLIFRLKEGAAPPDNSDKTGDFDVSDPKFTLIDWDADGDGTDEALAFDYEDLGDEAPSYIRVTLYQGNEEQEAILDRAYGLNRIFAKEDDEGPYLEIYYAMGDYYSHNAEGQCELRLRDGKMVLLGAE